MTDLPVVYIAQRNGEDELSAYATLESALLSLGCNSLTKRVDAIDCVQLFDGDEMIGTVTALVVQS